MKRVATIGILDRRTFVLSAAASAGVATLLSTFDAVAANQLDTNYHEALRDLLGSAQPIEGKVTLELPETAENGNTVPFVLSIDSPMTEAEHVRKIYLLSTANPQAHVATFELGPHSGKATVAGRMRLAKTQEVVTVAELSDGSFLIGKRNVEVTIGGCGS